MSPKPGIFWEASSPRTCVRGVALGVGYKLELMGLHLAGTAFAQVRVGTSKLKSTDRVFTHRASAEHRTEHTRAGAGPPVPLACRERKRRGRGKVKLYGEAKRSFGGPLRATGKVPKCLKVYFWFLFAGVR